MCGHPYTHSCVGKITLHKSTNISLPMSSGAKWSMQCFILDEDIIIIIIIIINSYSVFLQCYIVIKELILSEF